MPATQTNGASASEQVKQAPVKQAPKQVKQVKQVKQAPSLAQAATQVKAAKRRPVFRDVPGIPRVPLADGRVGCVQAELILAPDGSVELGPHMLTIPRKNADGTESGQRYSLSDVQALQDGFASAGIKLV